MSKSKAKARSEREFLRGEIRRLKKELRICKEQKGIQDPEPDEDDEDENEIICDECGKGALDVLDLGRAIYTTCRVCKIRKRL